MNMKRNARILKSELRRSRETLVPWLWWRKNPSILFKFKRIAQLKYFLKNLNFKSKEIPRVKNLRLKKPRKMINPASTLMSIWSSYRWTNKNNLMEGQTLNARGLIWTISFDKRLLRIFLNKTQTGTLFSSSFRWFNLLKMSTSTWSWIKDNRISIRSRTCPTFSHRTLSHKIISNQYHLQ